MLLRIGWIARCVSILQKIIYGNSFAILEVSRTLTGFWKTIPCKLKLTKLQIEFWTGMTIEYLILIKSWFYWYFYKRVDWRGRWKETMTRLIAFSSLDSRCHNFALNFKASSSNLISFLLSKFKTSSHWPSKTTFNLLSLESKSKNKLVYILTNLSSILNRK